MNKDYLSEFEREFELDDFSSESQSSEEYQDEYENDFSGESDSELDTYNEYELNDELDTQGEYEFEGEEPDSEMENYLQEYNSPDQEYEDRLYSALSGEYESSFEMEQEIDRVLHEMEKDYFFGGIKKFLKKKVGSLGKLSGIAKQFIPGGTLAALTKFAGGNLRNLLKSDLIKKGLSMAANAYLPGVGGMVAGKLLNSETPNADQVRAQATQAVAVAKDAYRNMAGLIPNLRPGNIPNQINNLSRQALTMAKNRHSGYRGRRNKQVIPRNPNSVVVVKPNRIIIYS